jgi:Head fiber protein
MRALMKSIEFKVKVMGDIPAHRLLVLGPIDSEGNRTVQVADSDAAADFVSVRNLTDGELTTVTLIDGLQVWEVESNADLKKGTWVYVGPNGTIGHRTSISFEHVGYLLEDVKKGELAKVLRRESFASGWGLDVNARLADLESRVSSLEGGGSGGQV